VADYEQDPKKMRLRRKLLMVNNDA
jgi:hypothetical protein